MESLRIKNLNHAYVKEPVLKDINLDFEKESFITIVGPNGSGKSTLIKKILKSIKPERNTIFLNNKDILGYNAKEYSKIVASVPQNTSVNYDFTVEEIVMMGRTPYISRFRGETDEDHAIVKRVLEETDLVTLKDRSFTSLSGGERQRVIIARALAQQPKILILDEPINHLDIKHKIQLMKLIKKLSEQKDIKVILVLHDLNFVYKYSDYCILLDEGKIYDRGAPSDVLTTENLKKVYDVDVQIMKNTFHDNIIVLPN
jgi:iron complex transport system ATP-binding protein